METVWHLFFSCPFAVDWLNYVGLTDVIGEKIQQNDSTLGVIMALIYDLNKEQANLFGAVIWQIWRE